MILINGRLHTVKNTRNHTVACTKSNKYKESQAYKQVISWKNRKQNNHETFCYTKREKLEGLRRFLQLLLLLFLLLLLWCCCFWSFSSPSPLSRSLSNKTVLGKEEPPHPHQKAAHKGDRNSFLHSLRSSNKDHRPSSLFPQGGVEKIPQGPNHLAATLSQSNIAPRNQSYQILMDQDRNGPQEKNLSLFVPAESKTFNQPLIRAYIL